ncbi:hypothetical protein T484DRAFT_1777731 [Baffinella frigidus]|nr:hypothetical protein T484DRAFT_1777731 [Cryptophyta sp. CCMP2293]
MFWLRVEWQFDSPAARGPAPPFAPSVALSREQAPLSLQKAQEEHATYVEVEIPADPKLPDCCFIEDCAVSIGRTVLLTNPGAASRRPEPPALSAPIRALPGAPRTLVSMLEMDSSATLDGGDVLHTERHVFVGLSSRTNAAGVEALRAALAPELPGGARSVFAIEVIGDLHLKSLATYAGNHQMAVDDSPGGRHLAQEVDRLTGVSGGYAWHVMSTHAATNLLRVNDFLIMQEGVKRLPEIGKLLDAAHVRPENAFEVPNQEFSKADGAVTCRSVLIQHLSHFRK